jgi:hypothetical protein
MKDIPFYSNRKGNNSCMLACFRAALEYLQDKPYTWKELEKLTGYRPKRAAWTVKIWTELADELDIRMIEGFDYARYHKEGEAYLHTFLKPEEVAWQLQQSNLAQIRPLIPEFLKRVRYEKRSPGLQDIDNMLDDGYLVVVGLNSKLLNGQKGYTAHMVLVHDREGDEYIIHDPGLPPMPNRHVDRNLLFKAMGGKDNTTEVTGIKSKAKHGN